MADTKISALTSAATPLAGTEVLPIVQSGATVKVSVADLTANRSVTASDLSLSTGNLSINTTSKGITTGSSIPLGLGVNNGISAITISTANFVGINTTSPANRLSSKAGNATYTNGCLSLLGSASGTTYLTNVAGALYVSNNGSSDHLSLESNGNFAVLGTIKPQLATTAGAPAYVKGAMYFDTTLNKLRIGGATGWETVSST